MSKNKKNRQKKIPKLFIASFSYGNGFPCQFVTSLMAATNDCNYNGITTSVDLRPSGPYVQKERNISIARFFESGCDYMLFIDADLSFDPTGPRRIMEKAMANDLDIVGGLYRYKMDTEAYPVQLYVDDETGEHPMVNGLIPAAGLPTGFMLISRRCIERMITEYPETRYEVKDSRNGETSMVLFDLFECLLYNGEWWGEDYIFCRRWTAIGGQLWAMPDIEFEHIGERAWNGTWAKWYEANKEKIVEQNMVKLLKQKAAETVSEAA